VRRALAVAALVAGPLLWRRRAARREHVQIAFEDGSAVELERGDAAETLLAIARTAV
jgi:hypothetical protein